MICDKRPIGPSCILPMAAIALLGSVAIAAEPPEPDPTWLSLDIPGDMRLFWDKGLGLNSADEKLRFKLGGKFMMDFTWANGRALERDLGINLEDRIRCRQIRPYVSGQLADWLTFKLEAEFADNGTRLRDAYLRLKQIPYLGSITVGHFKEPFGLELFASSAHTMFLEIALPNAFAPPRGWGVMANNSVLDSRATWAVGLFRDTDDECSGLEAAGNACAITGRATYLPWYAEDGRKLLHLGAAYSFRRPKDPIRYRRRPEAEFVEHFTDTDSFDAERAHLFGAEVAWVDGPLSLQGEYMLSAADPSGAGGVCLDGFYVQASYLLTGEHRPYDRRRGIFMGISPTKDFLHQGGWGAWEVAARYSYLDLDDGNLPHSARQMQDLTIGLNWYINSNVRIMWNYVRSCVDGADTSDAADIFLMRLQIAF